MGTVPAYSGLDLRGLPLRGLPSPQAGGDAVSRTYLEAQLTVLQAQLTALQAQLTELSARDRVVVGPTDPGAIRGLWVQTGVGPAGADLTLWVKE